MANYFDERQKLVHRLEGLGNGLSEEIAKGLENALESIHGKIAKLAAKAEQTESLVRRKTYQEQLRGEIDRVLTEVYQDMGREIESTSMAVAQSAPEITDRIIKKAGGFTIKTAVPKLSSRRVKAWFESAYIEGTSFNQWLTKLETNAVSRIVDATRQSLILKETRGQAAKRVQQALDIGKQSATKLAKTSIHQAQVWGELEYLRENEVQQVRWIAELDRRTCPQCVPMDQRIFNIEDVPLPPLHMLCRCWVMPVTIGERALKGQRPTRMETNPRWQNHKDGTRSKKFQDYDARPIDSKITYSQWMQSMARSTNPADVAFAREALGPKRFDLVSSGRLRVESLYYAGKLRTIDELKELVK